MLINQVDFTKAPISEIDRQIENAKAVIATLEATILKLSSDGHETTDATQHLGRLLGSLTVLLRIRTQESKSLNGQSSLEALSAHATKPGTPAYPAE